MKKRMLSALLAVILVVSLLSGTLTAGAKTDLTGSAVSTVLFYVKNSRGEDVLVSQNPVSDMLADMASGELDDTVYNYSVLDSMVTTVHQEAQGFTVAEFVEYAQSNSSVPALAELPLTFAGNDSIGFWEIDDALGYTTGSGTTADIYTYADLYGTPRWNYSRLYEYWDYTAQKIADPNGVMTQAETVAYIQENAEAAQTRLSVTAFSQRYIATTGLSGYNMEYLWSNGGLMDSAKTLRLMIPMTAENLANREHTANNSRSCIWSLRLEMENAPELAPLGTVAAPTGYLTEDADNYYVHFDCATAGASVYYNDNYASAANMPTCLYDASAPLAVPKSSESIVNGALSIKAHAVKDGYTDAGTVTLALGVGSQAPAVTAEEGYALGAPAVFAIDSTGAQLGAWLQGLTVTLGGTALDASKYSISETALTLDASVLASGSSSLALISGGFATQNLRVNVYPAAPAITAGTAYLGEALTFSFADAGYQSGATVMVKEADAAAWSSVSTGAYLDRTQNGSLTVLKSYFASESGKVKSAGDYIFKLTNAAYWPQSVEIPVTFGEKPYSTISAANVAGAEGETVSVPVTIENNLGFCDFGIQIGYDASVLTLDSITQGALLVNGMFTQNLTAARATWLGGGNLTSDGTLFTLNFTVTGELAAGASSAITVALVDGQASNIVNASASSVNVRFENGSVAAPGAVWDGKTVDTRWYNASDAAFTLDTPAELAGLAALVNAGTDDFSGKSVTLSADLDLGGFEWTPIGRASIRVVDGNAYYTPDKPFNGSFIGAGHSINGLSVTGSNSGVALFGFVGENGRLSDFTLRGSVSGAYYVAGAAAINGGDLDKIINRAAVHATNDYVGGVAAEGFGTLTITDCHNRASVSNDSNTRSSGIVSGIVARVETGSTATISRCSNSGDITGYQYVSGIIGGQFGSVDVQYCYNSGTITGVSFGKVYLGGITGKLGGGTIDSCYNTGSLIDSHWMGGHVRAVGGIAGCEEDRQDGATAISNCYTTGSITINTSNMEYGAHWIYEVGNISGGNSTTSDNMMHYSNCYYLENRINVADALNAGYQFWADVYKEDPLIWDTTDITPKTADEMRSAAFAASMGSGFAADSENVNGGYPVLYWQAGAEVIENEYSITTASYGSETALVTSSASASTAGQTITVAVSNIETGKRLKALEASDAAGGNVALTLVSEGVYSFTMPRRAVQVKAIFENAVSESALKFNVLLPDGLDAIWTVSADSTYGINNSIKAGATVFLTIEKAKDAAMTSLEGLTLTSGDSPVTFDTYSFTRDSVSSGWRGVYVFTMPEGEVSVQPVIEYAPFTVYSQESGGVSEAVKTYTRAQMQAIANENVYYTGCYDESMFFLGKAESAVSLTALLSDAGLSLAPGDSVKITAADGMDVYYTYEKLYGETRYYYPNIFASDAASRADGKTPVDAMLVISGNTQVGASDTPIGEKVCDTLNAYRFVYGQTETQFNNGVPAVENKVITDFPKYCASITVIKAASSATWDWDDEGRYDISWYDRADTEFHLSTAEELAGLAWIVNQGDELMLTGETAAVQEFFTGKTIYLDADIYLNDHDVSGSSADVRDDNAHQWPSISGGTSTSERGAVFDGTFDGQGHTIYNMYIFDLSAYTYYDARNRALFGVTAEAAVIKNVTVENGFVRGARDLAAIVGKTGSLGAAYDSTRVGHGSTIENCHNKNTTIYGTDGGAGCGGVVAAAWNGSIVRNCSNSGSVTNTGVYPAGGIAGKNENIIEGCVNTGAVRSISGNAGGITAHNVSGISVARNCVSTGSVNGKCAGGLVGYNLGVITDSYSLGSVTGTYAGGVTGEQSSALADTAYWLNASASVGVGKLTSGADNTVSKTSEEMKAAAFLTLLGDGWKADSVTSPKNSGYPVPRTSDIFYGDVNGDGKVSGKDTMLVAQHIVGSISLSDEQKLNADVSGDGKISGKDTMLIAQKIVGIITVFPADS